MDTFCLDSNIFIEAKNGAYGFDIVPGFWNWLDYNIEKGIIYSPINVYQELIESDDDLAIWAKDRRDKGLFRLPNDEIQIFFSKVADFVVNTYPPEYADPFLNGADPWVISYAKINNSKVVTRERFLSGTPKRVKIPNVCEYFHIAYLDTYTLLRTLKAQFN